MIHINEKSLIDTYPDYSPEIQRLLPYIVFLRDIDGSVLFRMKNYDMYEGWIAFYLPLSVGIPTSFSEYYYNRFVITDTAFHAAGSYRLRCKVVRMAIYDALEELLYDIRGKDVEN